jgi:hypothetical protein
MDAIDLESMPSDELWKLHEAVTAHLGNKLGQCGELMTLYEVVLNPISVSVAPSGVLHLLTRRGSTAAL